MVQKEFSGACRCRCLVEGAHISSIMSFSVFFLFVSLLISLFRFSSFFENKYLCSRYFQRIFHAAFYFNCVDSDSLGVEFYFLPFRRKERCSHSECCRPVPPIVSGNGLGRQGELCCFPSGGDGILPYRRTETGGVDFNRFLETFYSGAVVCVRYESEKDAVLVGRGAWKE